MLSKQELQVVIATLSHRRDWLQNNLVDNKIDAAQLAKNQQTLGLLNSALLKLQDSAEQAQSDSREKKLSTQARRAQLAPEKIRVLIAEDDQDIALLISTLLLGVGLKKIDIATDGIKAVAMLYDATSPYDLILCDWNMPLKNGLEVLDAVQSAERYRHACFVLISGITDSKKIRSAIEEGVDDYLVKPIDQGVLLKKIERFFPGVQQLQETTDR